MIELSKAVHTPETEEYGISSFVYERRIPFHAAKLNLFLKESIKNNPIFDACIRAKGYMWVA